MTETSQRHQSRSNLLSGGGGLGPLEDDGVLGRVDVLQRCVAPPVALTLRDLHLERRRVERCLRSLTGQDEKFFWERRARGSGELNDG